MDQRDYSKIKNISDSDYVHETVNHSFINSETGANTQIIDTQIEI